MYLHNFVKQQQWHLIWPLTNIQAHKDKQETPPLLTKFYFMKDSLCLFHIFNSLAILHYK